MADYGNPVKVETQEVSERVRETRVRLDEPVLDPNHELAVQIPEGVGASGVEDDPLGSMFDAGDAESQFAAGDADRVVTSEQPESRSSEQAREKRASRGKEAARSAKGEDKS